MTPLTHASLSSGIGGFDLAAEWAGWTNLFNCEKDHFCQRVLKYHFPNAIQYSDIRTTDFTIWRGCVDVLTGGFPCQPFSVAGKREGADDDRYLWDETYRVVDEVRPTWFLGENVNGITSMVFPGQEVKVGAQTDLFGTETPVYESVGQYIIDRICRDLEEIGYEVIPIVIPACAVGAPHERMRCFFLAHRTDAGTETMREGTYGVLSDEVTANPESLEDNGRRQGGFQPEPSGVATERTIADTDSERRQEYECSSESDRPEQSGRGISEWDAADAQSVRSPIARSARHRRERPENRSGIPNWRHFPTQPPICGGNDGLPAGLDGITFPKWRAESIKSYGNAIVPQVAYQIFKAINECELTAK